MIMFKKILLVTLVMFILTVTGCSGGGGTGTNQPQDVTLMLDWVPNTNHTGLYVALDKGWYKEEGLNVKIVQPNEGGTTQLVATGKAQFGVSHQEEVTQARASGVPVVSVATVIQHNTSGFASKKGSGITRPREMEGKRYGGWGSPTEEAVLKAGIEGDGGDFSRVKIFNTGTSDFLTSIERDVDFKWIFYGWDGINAEQKGIALDYLELRKFDSALDYYTPVLITGEQLIKDNPGLVEKFMRASARGYEFAIKNPDEAAGILYKNAPELDAKFLLASQKYLSPRYQDDAERWGVQKKELWDNYAKWMYERKLLIKLIDVDKAFTNEFLPK
jgi:ABC-type nitrate/sulfonate/bicarbonate transport system substrate-binding protein